MPTAQNGADMAVLIVGASVAGVRAAQALRSAGSTAEITVLGEEPHHPYDKPPLSKEMLLPGGDGAAVPLLSEEDVAHLGLDIRLNVRATGLDPWNRTVRTADGGQTGYDELIIATGAAARTLPGTEGIGGVYTIRTAQDAIALRGELVGGRRAVVIGAGFIGAEFASAASAHGVDVTIVEQQEQPLASVLGAEVGREIAALHTANGVALLTGVAVAGVEADERVRGVRLADGRLLAADVVVVGIGAVPGTAWLADSGLSTENGVLCDERLRAVGVDHVHAVGDVARWPHPFYGTGMRIEHWTNANEHAAVVAADLTGGPMPRPTLPYVWSDQYGRRIQIVGRPAAGTPVLVKPGPAPLAVYTDPGGVLVGAVVVDDPRALMKLRKAVLARLPLAELDLAGMAGVRTSTAAG